MQNGGGEPPRPAAKRAPRGGGSERGITILAERRFVKKVPQTSVAPTFKLTLPSEFVTGYLEHLVEKDFELVGPNIAAGAWEVTILPRKNKNKYEYTLQGWKAFALAHAIQPGDRIEFELLGDGRRMRAAIVKRAVYKELAHLAGPPGAPVALHPGHPGVPASPSSYHHHKYEEYESGDEGTDSGEGIATSSPRTGGAGAEDQGGVEDSEVATAVAILANAQRPRGGGGESGGGGGGSGPHLPRRADGGGGPLHDRRSPYLRTPTLPHEGRGAPDEASPPRGGGGSSGGGAAHVPAPGPGQAEASQPRPHALWRPWASFGSPSGTGGSASQAESDTGPRKRLKTAPSAGPGPEPTRPSPFHPFAPLGDTDASRHGVALAPPALCGSPEGASGRGCHSAQYTLTGSPPGGAARPQRRGSTSGMRLLSSVAELDALASQGAPQALPAGGRGGALPLTAPPPQSSPLLPPPQLARPQAKVSPPAMGNGAAVGHGAPTSPTAAPALMHPELVAAQEVLDMQTGRGMMAVTRLMGMANRLTAARELGALEPGLAAELQAMQAELKEHTDLVLEAMYTIRMVGKEMGSWAGAGGTPAP